MKGEVKILLGLGLITLIIFVGGALLLSSSQSAPAKAGSKASVLGANNSYTIAGSDKAVLVEFGDFECPACATAFPTVNKLLNDYQGKLTFAFRHFPIPSHVNEPIAAEAVEAAGEQGKFWEMFDKIYSHQKDWAEESTSKAEEIFLSYAKDLGLDTAKIKTAIDSNKFADKINQDYKDGVALGINSTPTFFFNGEMMRGVPDYNNLKSKIDTALK